MDVSTTLGVSSAPRSERVVFAACAAAALIAWPSVAVVISLEAVGSICLPQLAFGAVTCWIIAIASLGLGTALLRGDDPRPMRLWRMVERQLGDPSLDDILIPVRHRLIAHPLVARVSGYVGTAAWSWGAWYTYDITSGRYDDHTHVVLLAVLVALLSVGTSTITIAIVGPGIWRFECAYRMACEAHARLRSDHRNAERAAADAAEVALTERADMPDDAPFLRLVTPEPEPDAELEPDSGDEDGPEQQDAAGQ